MSHAPSQPVYSQPQPTNGLGLAGFIVSLVGFISCGLFSPIGLFLSLLGLRREPKGFAIAGLVLGLLGSVWLLVAVFVVGVSALGAIVGFGAATQEMGKLREVDRDFRRLEAEIGRYWQTHDALPLTLDDVPNLTQDDLTDPWGNRYRYAVEPGGEGYELTSDGRDGLAETVDDRSSLEPFTIGGGPGSSPGSPAGGP